MAPFEEYPPNLHFNDYYNVYNPPTTLDYAGGSINAFTSTANPVSYPFTSSSYEAQVPPEAFVALGPRPQQSQVLQQNPPFQLQPQQMIQQRQQQLANLSIQQPVFDLNNPQHHPLNQQSPSESISHSFEAYPPQLSNSPESGASVRSNSPSALGSPRMRSACVAPGLQASGEAEVMPTFIHHDSYGSDQSQPYDSMCNPVAASKPKATGFVGESKRSPSPFPFTFLASQCSSKSFLLPSQFPFQDDYKECTTNRACVQNQIGTGSEKVQEQQSWIDGRRNDTFSDSISAFSSFEYPELLKVHREDQPFPAERCTTSNMYISEFSSTQPFDQGEKKSVSLSPSLQDFLESSAYSNSNIKDYVDIGGSQSISCSSPFGKAHVEELCWRAVLSNAGSLANRQCADPHLIESFTASAPAAIPLATAAASPFLPEIPTPGTTRDSGHLHSPTDSRRFRGAGNHSPHAYQPYPQPNSPRRPSISSDRSRLSQSSREEDSETRGRGVCPRSDCGRAVRDLRSHMLTHQSERPEKCPITTCEFHKKGFARKYDKNRHTLTHYRGTMVCGFCSGSGSALEKTFSRADVFKRHLMSLHGVEHTPPNGRKKSPLVGKRGTLVNSVHGTVGGVCSTCSCTFASAQELYEHLDDCVLRVVQETDPSELINEQNLGSVQGDSGVQETLARHYLADNTTASASGMMGGQGKMEGQLLNVSTAGAGHAITQTTMQPGRTAVKFRKGATA